MRDEVNTCRLLFWQPHWCGFFSCPDLMWVIRLPCNKVWRVDNHSSSLCYSTLAVKYVGLSNRFLEPFGWEGDCLQNTKETFQLTVGNSESHASLFWPLTLTARLVTTSECIKYKKHGWFKQDAATKLWHEATARKKTKTRTSMLSKYHIGQLKCNTVITAWTFTQSSKIDTLNRCSDSMN